MKKKPSELTKTEWELLYPKKTLAEIASLMNCGEATVYKWVKRAGIILTKKPRNERSEEHRSALSKALQGRTGVKSGTSLKCPICSKNFYVIAARTETAKYCSVACRAKAVQQNWTGTMNPRYIADAIRTKNCQGCGTVMVHTPPKPVTSFLLQKYCTKDCADKHGQRLSGFMHPKFKGADARKRTRTHQDGRWASKVLQRDAYICKRCGVSGEIATLQAHHIRPYELFPELRGELSNGVTVCSRCHWDIHDTMDPDFLITHNAPARPVNKKKELLLSGAVSEGKVFGKDSRKWTGNCYWCGTFLVKRLSDVTNRHSTFCGKSCAMKHRRAFGEFRPTASELIPSTARPPKRTSISDLTKLEGQ